MAKTGHQIQTDIFNMLKGTSLISNLSGSLYRKGLRPRDSVLEDAVVIFTTADAEQIQEGVVTINIFVPDIYPFDNGVPTENTARCEAVEGLLKTQIDSMTADKSDYLFKLKNAIHTQHDDDLKQSFVVARLSFRLFQTNSTTTNS